jgi:hypothetical protein
MTDEQRAELKRLAEGAGSKRWKYLPYDGTHGWVVTDEQNYQHLSECYDGEWSAANGQFAAAANPAAVLDLLADLGKAEADNACALEHIRSHIARHEGTPTAERMKSFLAFKHPGANLFSELDALKAEVERLRARIDRLEQGLAVAINAADSRVADALSHLLEETK